MMQGGAEDDHKARTAGIPIAPYPPAASKNARFTSSAQVSSFSSSISSSMHQPSSLGLNRQQSSLSDVPEASSGEAFKNASAASLATPKLEFFQSDVLACINCSTERSVSNATRHSTAATTSKSGPLLMELRRIVRHEGGEEEDQTHFFRTESLFQARGNPNFGSSVASTCLSVHPDQRVCATGQSTGSLCLHTISTSGNNEVTAPEYYQNGQRMSHRAASAVAWRPHESSSQIAIGLTAGTASTGEQRPMRLAGAGRSAYGSNDRDYHCFIWDVEHQRRAKTTPLHRFAHQTGVSSLAWMLEGQVLALGNQQRNIQMYDLRMDTGGRAPLTVYAHNFGVNGVEGDPSKPFQFISFSWAMGEPVKLWDARRMTASPVTEIKLGQSVAVRTAEWAHNGQLTILHSGSLHCYDTSSGARPVFAQSFNVGETVQDFVTTSSHSHSSTDAQPFTNYLRKRVFVTRNDKSIVDLPFHRSAPLSFSKCTGEIINAFAGDIHFQTINNTLDDDISGTMMRRAMGNNGTTKYSVNIEANLRVLLDESEKAPKENEQRTRTQNELVNVWRWIDWIEKLVEEANTEKEKLLDSTLQFKGLSDAGVLTLLDLDKSGQDLQGMSKTLAVATFESKGRRAALSACGWPGNLSLHSVMKGREADGEYERSAALAVWYGDIGSAVDVLKRGMKACKERGESHHAETIELIMISIAGFRSGNDVGAEVWRKACGVLVTRIDQETTRSQDADYLKHILRFLMGVGDENAHKGMLKDTSLSLCDRAAFACRFLPQGELRHYLEFCITECKEAGNLEGLVITGFNRDGIEIIQSFVDRTADVQTAALLTSRVIFPSDSFERKAAWEWLHEYRSLLNRWQMWQVRAKFDVERADMLRNLKSRMEGYNTPKRRIPLSRRGTFRGADPDIQAPIPAQLDVRCNYCSASLGLRRADSHAWQSNMKNVLSCCPKCRKPLPRCSICLLSLGTLNPYPELATRGADPTTPANLPFAEWFTWCVQCRHGGHAHHLIGWFSKNNTCPISGCDCRCQFDSHQSIK